MHFSPYQQDIFAVATSTGTIEIYALNIKIDPRIELLQAMQPFPASILVLSLAWHPSPLLPSTLAVSLSDGSVAILDYASFFIRIQSFEAHSLEVWTVAWSASLGSPDCVLYSGGDDSRLCTIPLDMPALVRAATQKNSQESVAAASTSSTAVQLDAAESAGRGEEENPKLPSNISTENFFFNSKVHGAGVTAILPIQCLTEADPETILTGSYDEYIRVLVPEPNRKWKVAAEQRLGGGVWRLKLLCKDSDPSATPQTRFKVLASCMHAGSRILEVCRQSDKQWTIAVLARFEEHESMNYASDATRLVDIVHSNSQTTTVVSTSFYDRRLCVWNILDVNSS